MKDRFHIEEKLLLQIATRSSLTVEKSNYAISMLPQADSCVVQKDYVPFGKPQKHCDYVHRYITNEMKADAITLSKRPLSHLKKVLNNRITSINNNSSDILYDIEDKCDIEVLQYTIKNYAVLSSIPNDWFFLPQDVLKSLPK